MSTTVPEPPLENLDSKPDPLLATYKWADLVEINCLVRKSRTLSFADVVRLLDADADASLEAMVVLGHRADVDEADLVDIDSSAQDEDDEDLEDLEELRSYPSPGTSSSHVRRRERMNKIRKIRPVDSASTLDRRHVLAADVMELLRWRAAHFSTSYPFQVSVDGELSLVRRFETLDERQILYVFLLVCSGLSHVTKTAESFFTYPFERLSALAVKSMFPAARVSVFGTSSTEQPPGGSSLRDKVKALAVELHGTLGRDVEYLSDDNRGDKGLDVVGHISMGDEQEGSFVVFAQAACTDEWVTKQNAANPGNWKNTLTLQVPQFSLCTIPISFRRVGGAWHDFGALSDTLLVDRSRILHLVPHGFNELEDEIIANEPTRAHLVAILNFEVT